MDIIETIENRVKACPDKTAIFFREQKITFRQLRDISYKLASGLKTLALKPKDKVAVYLPNCPQYLFSYLAIWASGATIVPLDFMLTTDELISCIHHSEAKIAIIKSKVNIDLEQIKRNCPLLKEIILQDKKEGFLFLEELMEKGKLERPDTQINEKDYATIFYTSGTTGKPKGVLINYKQLEASPRAMEYFAGLNDTDLALCALPFSHLGGLVFLQAIIYLGSSIVIMERFIPIEFLKNIQNYKITCFWLVPPMYYAILHLKEFETFNLSGLKWVVSFGAAGSPEQLRRFHQFCPQATLLHGWGMTETNAPNVVLPKYSKKLESVGKVAPWIEVKIFESGSGGSVQDKELPKGQVGEIVIKGWVVTDGYYKDEVLTKETLRHGWFHTGDLGKFDNEDFLYIMGRKKEMIKVAGEIVFEPEVEAVLYRHPDIAEAAVVGVVDKIRGEVPKAIVALKEGKVLTVQDLKSFCKEHLAHFKIPHYYEFLKELPKNRTGKIDKEKLRS
jgi:long-chain acyl-CoA synthetase